MPEAHATSSTYNIGRRNPTNQIKCIYRADLLTPDYFSLGERSAVSITDVVVLVWLPGAERGSSWLGLALLQPRVEEPGLRLLRIP